MSPPKGWDWWNLRRQWEYHWFVKPANEEIAKLQREIDKLQRDEPLAWFLLEARAALPTAILIATVILLTPLLSRVLLYFAIVPFFGRTFSAVMLVTENHGTISMEEGERMHRVDIRPDEEYVFRTSRASSSGCDSRWKLMARPKNPFVCAAARLWNITAWRSRNGDSGTIDISDGNPDAYFTTLRLENHPGFVLRPGFVFGLSSGVSIRTAWRFGIHNWLNGQILYILFSGTGTILLAGTGGFRMAHETVEHSRLAGFDGRMATRAVRTENFIPYFLGQTSLLDQQFESPGLRIQHQSFPKEAGNVVHRFLNGILQGAGKFLGF